ncbi:monovalent cation:H+ antiporter, CPA1 (nhx1) [Puccinia graminis f. sp. tritici]|uniref:Sodium/hydrogen exchanger n=1 Tax=Puccinia graminis f. sp. tritici TaxID=56615 RepID=A0A5B0PTW5_PUCGR|nr:monovalent cation:H+ antiporter, CPA1 (nhx1) [Puccinia graminis f. sp. tritici]KAA1128212.1 monovalent cation:H+ antiporter, CPA1 (nhx1) [Puccinia graminis f. sp. tritici]
MEATKPPEIHLDPEVEELWSSRALLLVLVLLILSFWVSYYLKIKRIKTIHETLVALFAGMVIGLIVRLSPGEVVQNMISFKSTIMLNVLLPPIILASGYDLKEENFFRNFGVILTFAFCGTFVSAVVIGTLVYIWALLGFEGLSLGIIECLLFGSTLSATDPVTVLAIFNTLKVDPKLYSIIFGESLLNDAIAIVMFETLSHFHGEKISILSFFHGVGIFLLVFLTSMALGVVFGLTCSLMLKHSRVSQFPEIESCLVLLIAYTSYFFSNASTMSGIVSLLFCGITLKHYAYHNMSRRTQRTTKYMFTTLSSLCENFIFIYLGLSLFTQTQLVYKPIFIFISALSVCVARYCAVFPISQLVNVFFRKARGTRTDELPHSYQMMLFWAGLRGAVGVALAAGIKGDNAVALRTTVLVTVVLTMVIFGGTTTRMIDIVGIRTGVEDEIDTSDEEGLGIQDHGTGGFLSLARDDHRGGLYQDTNSRKSSLGDSLDQTTSKHLRNVKTDFNGANSDDPYKRFSRGPRDPKNGVISSPMSERSIATQDSDDEVLPSADAQTTQFNLEDGEARQGNGQGGGGNRKVWRDGQWFTVLDEQYLLPVFSNATASRKQASRKALRNQRASLAGDGIYRAQSDADHIPSPRSGHPNSAWNSEDSNGGGTEGNPNRGGGYRYSHHDDRRQTLRKKVSPSTPHTVFQGSFTDALSALVTNPLSSSSSKTTTIGGNSGVGLLDSLKSHRQSAPLKKKASDENCSSDHRSKPSYSHSSNESREKIHIHDNLNGTHRNSNLHQIHLGSLPSSAGSNHSINAFTSAKPHHESSDPSIGTSTSSTLSIQQTSNRIRSSALHDENGENCKLQTTDDSKSMNGGDDTSHPSDPPTVIDTQLLSSHPLPSSSRVNPHNHVRCRSRDQITTLSSFRHQDEGDGSGALGETDHFKKSED